MNTSDDLAPRLLRLTPRRSGVTPDRMERVHRAVRLEWQAVTARRRDRTVSRFAAAAAAAALVAAAATVAIGVRLRPTGAAVPVIAEPLGSVERIEGTGALRAGDPIRTGQWVETGSGSRIALRLASGASVRVDSESRARIRSAGLIELTSGGVYVDSGEAAGGLEVQTPLGTARDVGTQFEVRLRAGTLGVRVRSGSVELRHAAGVARAGAGRRIDLAGDRVTSAMIASYGADWSWVSDLAPPFAIEGRPLAVFLQHLAHEEGWTLDYADAGLAAHTRTIVLHGSVDGLTSREALSVALTSSGLDYRLDSGRLLVRRP